MSPSPSLQPSRDILHYHFGIARTVRGRWHARIALRNDAATFHRKHNPIRHIHLPPREAAAREARIVMVILVPLAGEEAVDKLVHRLALFFCAGQSAVTAVIEIAHDKGEQE